MVNEHSIKHVLEVGIIPRTAPTKDFLVGRLLSPLCLLVVAMVSALHSWPHLGSFNTYVFLDCHHIALTTNHTMEDTPSKLQIILLRIMPQQAAIRKVRQGS